MRARDNPFAADRVERIRYRFTRTSLDALLARLDDMDYRAAIVGPDGSGKTTLLEDLRRVLKRKGLRTKLIFVNDTSLLTVTACRQLLSELTPQEVVLLDGADMLGRSAWRLCQHYTVTYASGLIVTAHCPGLLPTLIECTTTPALLREIVTELIPPGQLISPSLLNDLHNRHYGNLRACLRELYDLYARTSSA